MGNYDDIALPVKGQPISSTLYGAKVKDAINDLDRRMSAYDASTGIGKAFSTSGVALATQPTETATLTITGFVFRAGYAYKAYMRAGVLGNAGNLVDFRVRKFNATPANGADWGEYFRTQAAGLSNGSATSALGTLYLINNTASDVTSDVSLTAAANASGCTAFATALSPRFFTIEPAGFAIDFVGMGVQVT